MVTPIDAPQAVGRTPTAQIALGVFAQYHDSGEIEDDLQTGTITERWVVTGDPYEVMTSPGMQGLTIRTKHYQFPEAYLVKRRFQHLAKSGTVTDRRTLVTLIYQRRPCPFAYEDSEVGTLISRPTWWSWDQPFAGTLTGKSPISVSVMGPSRLLIRRYPSVRLTGDELDNVLDELGKTNSLQFLGKPADYWLFQNVRLKMLYGDPETRTGQYEVSLYFLGDPLRHHKHWVARLVANSPVAPIPPNDFAEHEAVHEVSTIYQQSTVRFDRLIPIPNISEVCAPP